MGSVYLSHNQIEIHQERLLRQTNLTRLNHARWLRIRGMKFSARFDAQIMHTFDRMGQIKFWQCR